MKTSTMVAIGAGAVVAYFLLRPSTKTVMTPAGPIAVPAGATLTGENIAAAAGMSRERAIAEWTARGLTRDAAEARWNQAMTAVAATTGAMRGFGGYVG